MSGARIGSNVLFKMVYLYAYAFCNTDIIVETNFSENHILGYVVYKAISHI